MTEKPIIYQTFPRIMTNMNGKCVPNGTYEENGSGKMNHISHKVLRSLKSLGVTHMWYTGILEMATKTEFPGIPADNPNVVKGEAGSPYAIKDYYDVSPAIAEDIENRMEEFHALVDRTHDAGLKVIIDFVPNHTARVYHSDVAPDGVGDFGDGDDIGMFFTPKNNYYYITNQQFSPEFDLAAEGNVPYVEFPAKATGNDCFTAFCGKNDWYETVKLNYGWDPGAHKGSYDPVPDTWLRMLHILRFWASKGVDGFRCDMVFMVPVEFWHWAIPQVKKDFPALVFIGEIYDVAQYRTFLNYCGFDYLYDKVNLYDTLVGIERHNYSTANLTGCWQTVDGIGDRMLNFLENHDEVRFASNSFAGNPARVIPHLVVSAMMSKGPFMIYYGQELGEGAHENEGFAGYNDRSTIFDYWSYDTLRRWYGNGLCTVSKLTAHEKWLRNLYKTVLLLCNKCSAIREGEFFDLMYVNLQNPDFDPHRIFSFVRYNEKEIVLFIVNFAESARRIKLNIPDLCYDMAGIKEGVYQVNDLLWHNPQMFTLERGKSVTLEINGRDALLLPLRKLS